MNKLVVIGNSVTIRVRPDNGGKTYAELLSIKLNKELIHLGEGALLLSEFLNQKRYSKIPNNSHVLINFGIVDACTRPIPKYMYNFMMNTDSNSFKSSRKLLRYAENKYRKRLVKLRGLKSWSKKLEFTNQLAKLINLLEEKGCSYSILEINFPNQRIENFLPGSQNNVLEFNKEISLLKNVINVSDLTDTEHYPDGIHYNSEGHQKVTAKLLDNLT